MNDLICDLVNAVFENSTKDVRFKVSFDTSHGRNTFNVWAFTDDKAYLILDDVALDINKDNVRKAMIEIKGFKL
jgi:hypothetical protein